ncbi:hypothetical protein [Burkholderia sp. MSMB1589WGS]|uniref:hypothetical protein n=1 Tax=Burkholderia sp. MSMB1589WGS TaxID=1636425 RepID=UPI0018D32EC5|nr:hypothetical protein [Burkholderia sp. MSMB1589WGS]
MATAAIPWRKTSALETLRIHAFRVQFIFKNGRPGEIYDARSICNYMRLRRQEFLEIWGRIPTSSDSMASKRNCPRLFIGNSKLVYFQ